MANTSKTMTIRDLLARCERDDINLSSNAEVVSAEELRQRIHDVALSPDAERAMLDTEVAIEDDVRVYEVGADGYVKGGPALYTLTAHAE